MFCTCHITVMWGLGLSVLCLSKLKHDWLVWQGLLTLQFGVSQCVLKTVIVWWWALMIWYIINSERGLGKSTFMISSSDESLSVRKKRPCYLNIVSGYLAVMTHGCWGLQQSIIQNISSWGWRGDELVRDFHASDWQLFFCAVRGLFSRGCESLHRQWVSS